MRIPTDRPPLPKSGCARRFSAALVALAATLSGCGGEPTQREVQNARAFEAMLTAISLKHDEEFEKDARLIDERHAAGEISDKRYRQLAGVIEKGRAKDWPGAEKRAYEFRAQFGDRGSFFE